MPLAGASLGQTDVDSAACLPTQPISEHYCSTATIAGYGVTKQGDSATANRLRTLNITVQEDCGHDDP